jgi:hypothetical protein
MRIYSLLVLLFLGAACTQQATKAQEKVTKEALVGSWEAVTGKLVKKNGQVAELDMTKEKFLVVFDASGSGVNSSMQDGVEVKRLHEWVLDGTEVRIYEKLHPYLEIWKIVDVGPKAMVIRIIFNNDPEVAEGIFRLVKK